MWASKCQFCNGSNSYIFDIAPVYHLINAPVVSKHKIQFLYGFMTTSSTQFSCWAPFVTFVMLWVLQLRDFWHFTCRLTFYLVIYFNAPLVVIVICYPKGLFLNVVGAPFSHFCNEGIGLLIRWANFYSVVNGQFLSIR